MIDNRSNQKIVICEGPTDKSFDVECIRKIFPEFAKRVNLIPGDEKAKVQSLHRALENASAAAKLGIRVCSLVDQDDLSESVAQSANNTRQFTWSRYHIENYLLSEVHILRVLKRIDNSGLKTLIQVEEALKNAAKKTMPNLLMHRLIVYTNKLVVGSIDWGIDPQSTSFSQDMYKRATSYSKRICGLIDNQLSEQVLQKREAEISEELTFYLNSLDWKKRFRGREILKMFASDNSLGLTYETFRNLIVQEMVDDGHQPDDMADVIAEIDKS